MKRCLPLLLLCGLCGCDPAPTPSGDRITVGATRTNLSPIHIGEFVKITDINGKEYMFRPHMVIQITSTPSGCDISVAGIGSIPMACSIGQAAKLVKAE